MELDFSVDQEALRDSIRAVLAKEAPVALAREVAERGSGADRLARVAVELGWPALTVPEEFGGIGLGAVEAGILAEELGRVIAPGPLLTTLCGFVPVIDHLGTNEQRARFLRAVASGELAGTIAPCGVAGAPSGVTAVRDARGITLSGRAIALIEPAAHGEIAAAVQGPGGAGAVVVPVAEATVVPMESIDPTRILAHVGFDGVHVGADRVLGGLDAFGGRDALIASALLPAVSSLALETVGLCQSIFDVTLEYARHREQFGVPIGSFQAIKHKFADMIVALERARATGYLAALCIAERDERAAINTSVAKAAASDAQRLIVKEGIQIHGGIGYTWEHDMHLYAKRAKANEALYGTANEHRARIAELLGV